MKFTFTDKKVNIPNRVHTYAEKKIGKLDRYFQTEPEASIVFSVEKGRNNLEVTIRSASTVIRVAESTSDMFVTIDAAVASIERQLRKNKSRLEKRLRKEAFELPDDAYFVPENDVDEEAAYQIVRTKRFFFRPMSVEEAILQMNLVDHTFFAFRNADEGGAFSVVYKRNDGGYGIISNDIDLSGSLELTAKAGSPNGKALSQNDNELDLDTIKEKLGPGAKVTVTDANGETKQVSIPRPVEPEKPVIPGESSSSSDGGSSAPSAPASSIPGLTVTDKSGAVISYTSTQSGNTLTVCVGRFTASLRASLSALRPLRAEGIETITFQTILCSTTLSVDELLAMGGEDAEVVLTHHIRSSTLTVGGKAV